MKAKRLFQNAVCTELRRSNREEGFFVHAMLLALDFIDIRCCFCRICGQRTLVILAQSHVTKAASGNARYRRYAKRRRSASMVCLGCSAKRCRNVRFEDGTRSV